MRIFTIIYLLLFAISLLYISVTNFFIVKRMLDKRREKRIIDWKRYKKGLKPEMRDSILKMR